MKLPAIATAAVLISGCTSLLRPNFTQELVELRSGEYLLDKQHSFINFRVDHLGLSTLVGRFNTIDATLDFDPQNPAQLKVSGIIDSNSVDLNNATLEDALLEDRWFDAEQFPQISYTSTGARLVGENQFEITGNITLRGQTRPLMLDATFNGGADNLFTRKYTVGFSANATLQRSDFGMNSFSAFVGDTIEIELHGEFQRQ